MEERRQTLEGGRGSHSAVEVQREREETLPWVSRTDLERRQGMRADAWACVRAL